MITFLAYANGVAVSVSYSGAGGHPMADDWPGVRGGALWRRR